MGGPQRFDQGTFQGRLACMLLACDPALLLYTEANVMAIQRALLEAKAKLEINLAEDANVMRTPLNNTGISSPHQMHKQTQTVTLSKLRTQLSTANSHTLWESRRIVESALHPGTGKVIPRPFWMLGYVPYNRPICVSMVASTSTIPLLFWSWANQSQNALINYYVSAIDSLI